MAALRLAYSPFWKALKQTQPIATPITVACLAMITSLAAPSSAMASVQRCLRPRRCAMPREWVVRSDSAPAIGVASPVTQPARTCLVGSASAGEITRRCCVA